MNVPEVVFLEPAPHPDQCNPDQCQHCLCDGSFGRDVAAQLEGKP